MRNGLTSAPRSLPIILLSAAVWLAAGCASPQPQGAEELAAAGRQVETVSVGSSQGGALAQIEIETAASVIDLEVPVGLTSAWAVLPEVFEILGIEATTVDRPSYSAGNERFVVRSIDRQALSNYLECGSSFGRARADQYEVTMQILVQLAGAPGGATRIRTTLDAYARPRDVAGNAYHCTSKGTLERRIAELVEQLA
jgi:hypothetical protein